MNNNNIDDILTRNARNTGMTVPEGYFADFAARMEASLPDHAVAEAASARRVTLWTRLRPYAYMAAMFCGVWLMMWIFNDISTAVSASHADEEIMASLAGSETFYDYCAAEVSEYEIMDQMYADGVDPVVLTNY